MSVTKRDTSDLLNDRGIQAASDLHLADAFLVDVLAARIVTLIDEDSGASKLDGLESSVLQMAAYGAEQTRRAQRERRDYVAENIVKAALIAGFEAGVSLTGTNAADDVIPMQTEGE